MPANRSADWQPIAYCFVKGRQGANAMQLRLRKVSRLWGFVSVALCEMRSPAAVVAVRGD